MNLFILLFSSCLIAGNLHSKLAADIQILNYELSDPACDDMQELKEQVLLIKPDIICLFGDSDQIELSIDFEQLKNDFPYYYQNLCDPCTILSQLSLDQVRFHDIGTQSIFIEIASSELDAVIINAHLPEYSHKQLETVKNYIISQSKASFIYMTGDLEGSRFTFKNNEYLIIPKEKA